MAYFVTPVDSGGGFSVVFRFDGEGRAHMLAPSATGPRLGREVPFMKCNQRPNVAAICGLEVLDVLFADGT